jgi:hypothetical protein
MFELRGTPRLGRTVAPPAVSLAAAAWGGALAWTAFPSSRLLAVVAVTGAFFGLYQLVGALRSLARQRREADDWLRTATGGLVPPRYAWRAAQLCAPRLRRMLARTLRLLERSTREHPLGWRAPAYLNAVREHRALVLALARALEDVEQPVTPAGMLRVTELVQDGGGPLWGSAGEALAEAISATFAILTPQAA